VLGVAELGVSPINFMKNHTLPTLIAIIASNCSLFAASQIQISATISGNHGKIPLPALVSNAGEKFTPNTTTTTDFKLPDGRIVPIRFSLMCSASNSDGKIKYYGTFFTKDVILSKASKQTSITSFASTEHIFSGTTAIEKPVFLKFPDHSVLKLEFSELQTKTKAG
jgi:hypothetical protein